MMKRIVSLGLMLVVGLCATQAYAAAGDLAVEIVDGSGDHWLYQYDGSLTGHIGPAYFESAGGGLGDYKHFTATADGGLTYFARQWDGAGFWNRRPADWSSGAWGGVNDIEQVEVLANGNIVTEVVDSSGDHWLYQYDPTLTGPIGPEHFESAGGGLGDFKHFAATADGGITYFTRQWDGAGSWIRKDAAMTTVAWGGVNDVEEVIVLANGDIVTEVVDDLGDHYLYLYDGTATDGIGPAYFVATNDIQYLTATDGGVAYWDSTAGDLIWKDSTLATVAWATPGNVEQIVVLSGPIPGDVNGDGWVSGSDLSTIITYWGQSGLGRGFGDLNGNGTVDGPDYTEVLTYWGTGSPPEPPSGIPEPATLALLVIGGLTLLRRHNVA